MDTFGQEVKRLREEKGLSQNQLAEMVGLTQGYISHVEKDIREGKVEVLFALSRALDVSCEHFAKYFPATSSSTEPAEVKPEKPVKKAKPKKK